VLESVVIASNRPAKIEPLVEYRHPRGVPVAPAPLVIVSVRFCAHLLLIYYCLMGAVSTCHSRVKGGWSCLQPVLKTGRSPPLPMQDTNSSISQYTIYRGRLLYYCNNSAPFLRASTGSLFLVSYVLIQNICIL